MKVRVWNDNKYDFRSKFRDKEVKIASGDYITMEYDDAKLFKYDYHPIKLDHDGRQKAESFKIIRLELPKNGQEGVFGESDPLMNHATGEVATSAQDLEAQTNSQLHLMVDDEEVEKRVKAQTEELVNKRVSEELEKRVQAEVEKRLAEPKRRPGRPRKPRE